MTATSATTPSVRKPSLPFFAGVALLALAGLALWLRLRLLGYTEIWSDQSITLDWARAWVQGGPVPLVSIKSSLGPYNFPLIEYLFALPLFFRTGLLGVAWLLALINLAGVGIAAWATARVFGWRTAWWAALLFIVNPWAVYYGRLVWMQSFVPGFTSIFFASVLLYVADQPHTRYVVGAALSLSAVIQSHPTGLLLAGLLVILGACFWRRLRVWPCLLGAGLFLLSISPYLIFEAGQGFADWNALQTSVGGTADFSFAPLTLMVELLQSKRVYLTLGSASAHWQAMDLNWPVDTLVGGWLALAVGTSVVKLIFQGWRHLAHRAPWHARWSVEFILLVWFALPVLVFFRHTFHLQNYYFLYIYPVPLVLMALLSDQLFGWLRRVSGPQLAPAITIATRLVPALAFLPLAIISFQQARLDVLGQNLLAAGAAGHQRLVDTQRAIEYARQLLHEQPQCQLVVISEGDTYAASRFSLLHEFTEDAYNAHPDRVRFVEAGAGLLVPTPCAYYFSVTPNAGVRAWLTANTHPLPEYTIKTPEETWAFYALPTADTTRLKQTLFTSTQPQAEWDNGIQMRNHELKGDRLAGGTLSVNIWWVVTRPVVPRAIHFGTYLLTTDHQLVTQADGPGIDSAQWQVGDVFQTTSSLSLPAELQAGEYTLAQALYFYPDIERLPLTHPAGDLAVLDTLNLRSLTP